MHVAHRTEVWIHLHGNRNLDGLLSQPDDIQVALLYFCHRQPISAGI